MAAVQYNTGPSAVDGNGGVWRIGSVKRRRLFAKVRGWPLWRGYVGTEAEKLDGEVSFYFYYFFLKEVLLCLCACLKLKKISMVGGFDPVPLNPS
jgi:hypothetical protein